MPKYSITAYYESGSYRKENDPYSVGAITRPRRDQDKGGKTYGAYQFETYIYRDGTQHEKESWVKNSTLQRFLRSPNNPFGPQLRAVADRHGVASDAFDAAWKELANTQNRAFGLAQQAFLEEDKMDDVERFFDRANVSSTARQDEQLMDLTLGTLNLLGSLAKGVADHVKATQEEAGRPLSVKEIAVVMSDYKHANVSSNFKSSPGAHDGIRARYRSERAIFE